MLHDERRINLENSAIYGDSQACIAQRFVLPLRIDQIDKVCD